MHDTTPSVLTRLALAAAVVLFIACSRGSDRPGGGPGGASDRDRPAEVAAAVAGIGGGATGADATSSAEAPSTATPEGTHDFPLTSSDRVPAVAASETTRGLDPGRNAGPEPIPLAPMGSTKTQSALVNSPGYTPPDDPEWDAFLTGKRKVGPVAMQLTGGFPSGEALAEAVLDAVNRDDVQALHAIRMTYEEFETILWPEFPQSRPITNIKAEHAWEFYMQTSLAGATRGVHEWTGRNLRLERVSYSIGLAPYTNFNLYRGAVIHALTGDGEHVQLTFAFTFLERNGRWKVYIYKD
jgi:hypothetical protein